MSRKSDPEGRPVQESEQTAHIRVKVPADVQPSLPMSEDRAARLEAISTLKRLREAQIKLREGFLLQEGVLGVGYGPSSADSDKSMDKPAIIILVTPQLLTDLASHGLSFPNGFDGFPVIVRQPSNKSPLDDSIIDWVKVYRIQKTLHPPGPPSRIKTRTIGQVFVIEDPDLIIPAGSMSSSATVNWMLAYEDFRTTWSADDYDFIAMYVDLVSYNPGDRYYSSLNFVARHHHVFNDVTGINLDQINDRGNYSWTTQNGVTHVSNRLLGVQRLPKTDLSLTKNPTEIGDLAGRNTRLHEIGHQWTAYVCPNKLTVSGGDSWAHWLMKFDSDVSSVQVEPNNWRRPLGWSPLTQSFAEYYVPPAKCAYCPLDLYLMGLLSYTDPRLAQMYYINNLSPSTLQGTDGFLHTGTRHSISVHEIQQDLDNDGNINGPRNPDATHSQRSFRQAFVLFTNDLNLTMSKPTMGVLMAQVIDEERLAHAYEFRSATESRSVLDTYLYNKSYDHVFIRDNDDDVGDDSTVGVFWDSPDIWVRNSDDWDTLHDDTHQSPIRGQDNWIYARVRNNGTQDSGEITVNVFRANYAGTEFLYPEDWRLEDCVGSEIISAGVRVGGGAVVARFKWKSNMIPDATWHPCLLAEILPINLDYPAKSTLHHVWEDRRIAQKNITIVDPRFRKNPFTFPFSIGSRSLPTRFVHIHVRQKAGPPTGRVVLDLGKEDWLSRLERFSQHRGVDIDKVRSSLTTNVIKREELQLFVISNPRKGAKITLPLLDAERLELKLEIDWARDELTEDASFEITQLTDDGEIVGGLSLTFKGNGE